MLSIWLTGKLAKAGKRTNPVPHSPPSFQTASEGPNSRAVVGVDTCPLGPGETTSLPQSPDSQYREITSLLFSKRPGVTCWLKTPQSFPILSEGTCREMVMVYSLRVLLKHSMSGKNGINHPPPHTSDLILNANRE